MQDQIYTEQVMKRATQNKTIMRDTMNEQMMRVTPKELMMMDPIVCDIKSA